MLPTPTTTSPASSTCLIGGAAPSQAGMKGVEIEAVVRAAPCPSPPSSLTRQRRSSRPPRRPRRRSGADRSVAACRGSVTRSKWSCAPGTRQRARRSAGCPTCPGAAAAGPRSRSTSRYLPRRRTARTVRPTSASGSTASAQRSGLPTRTASMRAPAMRSAKPRRVDFDFGQFGHVRDSADGRSRRRSASRTEALDYYEFDDRTAPPNPPCGGRRRCSPLLSRSRSRCAATPPSSSRADRLRPPSRTAMRRREHRREPCRRR